LRRRARLPLPARPAATHIPGSSLPTVAKSAARSLALEVERGKVDARATGVVGAALEDSVAGRLWAVAELHDERRRMSASDVNMRPQWARTDTMKAAAARPTMTLLESAARMAPRTELVADARGRALAQRGREHVDERRGLHEDAHGLVPPPLMTTAVGTTRRRRSGRSRRQ